MSAQRTSESLVSRLYGGSNRMRENVHGEILMKDPPEHASSDIHCTASTYDVSRAISGSLYSFGASCHAMVMARSAATTFSPSDSSCRSSFTLSSSMYMAFAYFGFSESHRWCSDFANDHGKSCKFSNTSTSFFSSGAFS